MFYPSNKCGLRSSKDDLSLTGFTVIMKKQKNTIILLGLVFICLFMSCLLCGCAARRPLDLYPDYALTIEGKKYLPLIDICRKEGISWDYDTITQTVALTKKKDEAKLMVGSSIVLIDGRIVDLKSPVKLHKGMVIVPYSFRYRVLKKFSRTKTPAREKKKSYYKISKVCLDSGHGGKDPGTIGRIYGLKEKDVNLDIVRRVKKELKAEGIKVVTTRNSDVFVSLGRRAEIANKSGVDLFISIHANANRRRRVAGFEVYYISDDVDDVSRALVLAKDKNSLTNGQAGLYFDNTSIGSLSVNEKAIILDMLLTENRGESWGLAQHICEFFKDAGVKVSGVRGAKFTVLKRTQMPAILVEVGYMSNAREERYLRSASYRQQIAEGLVAGILSYKRHVERVD